MKIEIDMEQRIINSESHIYIKNIKMKQRQDLPRKYLISKEFIHKHKGSVYYFKNHMIVDMDFLCEGATYAEEYFFEKLETIKKCANDLHKINLAIAENLIPNYNHIERTIAI